MRISIETGQNFSTFLAARLVFVTVLLGVAALFESDRRLILSFLGLFALNAGMSLGFWEGFRRRPHTMMLRLMALFGAVIVDTLVLHRTGGAESEFVFLYFFSIGAAGLLTGLAGAFTIALLSVAGVAWLTAMETSVLWSEQWLHALVYSIYFLLTAFLATFVFEKLRERERSHQQTLGELERARLDTQAILDALNSGVVVISSGHRVLYTNPASRDILGLPAESAEAARLALENDSLLDVLLDEVESPDRSEQPREIGLRTSAGPRPIELRCSDLASPSGDGHGHILIVTDLTQRKEAERAERARDRLAAIGGLSRDLAHEIRNPLATVRGCVEMIQLSKSGDEETRPYLDLALRESDRLNQLLRDFLAFAHLDAPRKQHGDLATLVRHRLCGFDPRVRVVDALPEHLECDFDETQMILVVDGILLSLAEWAEGRGDLRISPGMGHERGIRFLATGCVIPPSEAAALFQPFSGTRKSSHSLALPTAWRAVNGHGGELLLESESETGTWFELAV